MNNLQHLMTNEECAIPRDHERRKGYRSVRTLAKCSTSLTILSTFRFWAVDQSDQQESECDRSVGYQHQADNIWRKEESTRREQPNATTSYRYAR